MLVAKFAALLLLLSMVWTKRFKFRADRSHMQYLYAFDKGLLSEILAKILSAKKRMMVRVGENIFSVRYLRPMMPY